MTQTEAEPTRADGDEAPEAGPFAAGNTNELEGLDLAPPRRWPWLLAGAVLGIVGTVAVSALVLGDDGADEAAAAVDVEIATAPVEVRDLVEEIEYTADLGYGTPVEVPATSDGVVTAAPDIGTVLERGDVVVEVDDRPVVLVYGDVPAWRDLAEGEEGADVRQLEMNLVALGYDPDDTVTIDDEYTANTALMVERWQEDLGLEPTGTVPLGDVLVAPGPVTVTTAPVAGSAVRAGTSLAELSARSRTTTVVGSTTGQITDMLEVGDPVEQGSILYAADGVGVMALTEPDSIGAYLVDPDVDAAELESALVFAGYDPDGAIVVDGEYDDATVAAVVRWQEATGLPTTGQLTADAYAVVPAGTTVAERLYVPGQDLPVPRPVLQLAAPTLSVVVPVDLAEQDTFSVDQPVQVELADGTVVEGVVVDVGTVATSESPEEDPTIDVVVELTELVEDDLPASSVTVVVAGETIRAALVVPTRALVTLAEGGFAVEKVLDDGTTVLVGIDTGTFDDGVVEVESSQLEQGDSLVVPA